MREARCATRRICLYVLRCVVGTATAYYARGEMRHDTASLRIVRNVMLMQRLCNPSKGRQRACSCRNPCRTSIQCTRQHKGLHQCGCRVTALAGLMHQLGGKEGTLEARANNRAARNGRCRRAHDLRQHASPNLQHNRLSGAGAWQVQCRACWRLSSSCMHQVAAALTSGCRSFTARQKRMYALAKPARLFASFTFSVTVAHDLSTI